MLKQKVQTKNRKGRKWLLFLSVLFITAGLGFSTTNAYTLLKGYILFKMEKEVSAFSKTKQPEDNPVPKKETPDKRKSAHKKQDTLYPVRPKKGEEIGTLSIPKLNANLPIFHGADESELKKGVGHFENSVLPGEKDNCVLSGHNDTVFRKLGEVGEGDILKVTTSAGEFTYKINKVRIVDADDRTVIVPKLRATLTVTTCYPFNTIGFAPQRYILSAYLLSKQLSVQK